MNDQARGMGGHHINSLIEDEWLTPPEILEVLGPFDLDPCAPRLRPWKMAKRHYTVDDNGLMLPWEGRVWCNPPYGRNIHRWLGRCAKHNNAIALIYARTETKDFFKFVWERCDAMLFIRHRLYFYYVDGTKSENNSGAPSVLIAYGENNVESLSRSGIEGAFVRNWEIIHR